MTILSIFVFSSFSSAYVYDYCMFPGSPPIEVTWKFVTSNLYARSSWASAFSYWNNAQSQVHFSQDSSSTNTVGHSTLVNTTDYGFNEIGISGYTVVYFNARINLSNPAILNGSTYNYTVAASAATHELGHPLGLGDLTSGTAIMNVNRDRSTIYKPQTDDIDGVNWIYGN